MSYCKQIVGFIVSVSVLIISTVKAQSYLTIENKSNSARYLTFQAYHSGHRQTMTLRGTTYVDGQLIAAPSQSALLVRLNNRTLQSTGTAYIYNKKPLSSDPSQADCILWWQENSEDNYCIQTNMSAVKWERGNEALCGISYNNTLPSPRPPPCV